LINALINLLYFYARVDQSITVQARITKFSPSAARNNRYAIKIENLVFCILT